jgi:hypothetical protein
MDKCSNNFGVVCKKFYVSSVFSELNPLVGTYMVSNLAQPDILKFHLSFNKALVSCFCLSALLIRLIILMVLSAEVNLFENLHSFKVAEASDLISWLDFLVGNLFLCFGDGVYRQYTLVSPWVLIVRSIWQISISLPMSLIALSVS